MRIDNASVYKLMSLPGEQGGPWLNDMNGFSFQLQLQKIWDIFAGAPGREQPFGVPESLYEDIASQINLLLQINLPPEDIASMIANPCALTGPRPPHPRISAQWQ